MPEIRKFIVPSNPLGRTYNKKQIDDKIGAISGGSAHTIQDEGTPLTQRASLNFVGTAVEVTDDAGNNATKVTINAGSGAVDSVNGQTGTVVLDADDIDDTTTAHKFISATERTNWDTAYGWGDHSTEGYLTAETDPVFSASEAALFAAGDAAKLAGIAAGAEVNVNADWNSVTGDSEILNKPSIPVNSDFDLGGLGDVNDTGKDTGKVLKYNAISGDWEIGDDNNTTYTATDFDIKDLTDSTSLRTTWSGKQDALTFGIADNNAVEIDMVGVADNDYAKFTANGLEGRSYSEVKQDLDLEIGTDVAAQTHAAQHAVGGADTVFPADPGADRYLMWDDDPGALVWAEVSGGTDEKVKYDSGDPTAGYVADKIVAGTGISVAEGSGATENKLVVASTITQATRDSLGLDTDDTVTFANLSGTNTGDQAVFKTIAVAGQDDVVADTTTDTLTLAAGTGITLSTTAASDTVTITSSITQYTDELAQDAVGGILTDSTQIDFTYNDDTPSITATIKTDSINDTHIDFGTGANQVSTADVPEQTNLYFTDERAQDAVGNAVGNGLDYDDTTGAISVDETELTHNSLGSKQGGTTNEYYHLTAAQATVVGNTSGTNTGDQTITNSSDATSHTVTLSASGGSVQLVEGSNITLTTTGTADNGVVTIAATAGGTGDVVGPAGAVDSNFAAFDTITGKLIKDSGSSASSFMAAGSVTQYTDEMAQDAVGNAIGNGLDYDDPSGAISVDESELTHNSIGSIQGGTPGEYYHITSAQNSALHAAGSDDTFTVANEATDTSCFPLFVTAETGDLGPKTNANLTFNSSTGALGSASLNLSGLTASELVATDGSKNLSSLAVATYPSLTEVSYVKGVTSAIQTQLNGKAAALGADDNYVTDAEKAALHAAGSDDTFTVANEAADTTCFPLFVTAATGDLGARTNASLTFNSSNGTLAATTFVGALTGTASGNLTSGGALGTPSSGTLTNCTGLPVNGIVDDTTSAIGVGTLELGHASDTTLSRSAAGTLAVEGVDVLTTSNTKTVSNKTLSGAIPLEENASIDLDPALSADGKYSGICITGTAGAALSFGDLIYLAAADSRWELADADAATTADQLLGICVLAAAGDGSATKILLQGNIRADTAFPTLTIGAPVYVGETAGDVQTAIPTGADNVIRRVGYALTADSLYFNPSMDSQTTVA